MSLAFGLTPELLDFQIGGRKGKTCSMSGCHNTHQRCPTLSFFRFPKELSRAKEWLNICDRPDLLRRVDLGEININNYYVCETHFPNQILDYATRKILIKTALPLTLAETKLLPFTAGLMMNPFNHLTADGSNKNGNNCNFGQDDDDDFDEDDNELEDEYSNNFIPQVIISKTEGNYQADSMDAIQIPDDDSYLDDSVSRNQLYWTTDATKHLIKLRGEREIEFSQNGSRKSLIWIEISNKMREAGYDFSPEKVSKKWHNIMITYNKNAEKKNGFVNWEFFDDIDAIYKTKNVNDVEPDLFRFVNPVPLERLQGGQNGKASNGFESTSHKRRPIELANARSESRNQSPEPYRNSVRNFKKFKFNSNQELRITDEADIPPGIDNGIDQNWWKDYFERKLELEREKIRKQDERHKDQMNFQKMAIMLQEKVEKIKVDAINSLTSALLRLEETKTRSA